MNTISFYRTDDPYGEFSNFAPYPIYIDGTIWRTTEHYFQASKFDEVDVKEKFCEIESPMEVAMEGRKRTYNLRKDWEDVKDDIMHKALSHKFMQHTELKKMLIATGDSLLIEHTENDSYWADGGDGTGKNKLGILLMQVREELVAYSKDPEFVLPPWIAFPGTEMADTFYRMGWGEDYRSEWADYFETIDQTAYRERFPEVKYWRGFYDDDPVIEDEYDEPEIGSDDLM